MSSTDKYPSNQSLTPSEKADLIHGLAVTGFAAMESMKIIENQEESTEAVLRMISILAADLSEDLHEGGGGS